MIWRGSIRWTVTEKNLALLLGEFLVHEVALRLTKALHHDLLRRLGGDATGVLWQHVRGNAVPDLHAGPDLLRVLLQDVELWVPLSPSTTVFRM